MTAGLTAAVLGGALLAGLAGSPHCVGMCGGFAVAAGGGRRPVGGVVAWSAGRLTTYATLGALAGAFGHLLPGPGWVGAAVAGALLVFFAARLAGLLPAVSAGPAWVPKAAARVAGRADLPSRFAFGAATGLLPCGLVYAALAFPVAAASPAAGALAMVAFGAGTLPALGVAAVGLRRITARSPWARRGLAAVVLVFGLGALGMRGGMGPAHATPPDAPAAAAPSCH